VIKLRAPLCDIKETNLCKPTRRGRKRFFDAALYLAGATVKLVFAREHKLKRLVLRYQTKQKRHLGFKLIAFSLIDLREFCEG
jgi:hypothetical protein